MNRNEELICLKEKALDKLRYRNIKIKHIKIKDARIRNNKTKCFRKTKECSIKRHKG